MTTGPLSDSDDECTCAHADYVAAIHCPIHGRRATGPLSDAPMSHRHALYVGWVLGIAMRNGIDARPEVDEQGNYTCRLIVTAPDGTDLHLVVPPPPDDWTFDAS